MVVLVVQTCCPCRGHATPATVSTTVVVVGWCWCWCCPAAVIPATVVLMVVVEVVPHCCCCGGGSVWSCSPAADVAPLLPFLQLSAHCNTLSSYSHPSLRWQIGTDHLAWHPGKVVKGKELQPLVTPHLYSAWSHANCKNTPFDCGNNAKNIFANSVCKDLWLTIKTI